MPECDVCGSDFDSEKATKVHKTRVHDVPWRDEDTLRELYIDKEMSTVEIADKFDVSRTTVCKGLEINGIESGHG
jgi:DNA-binding transcriptional regulator LsrR (DeoR family)